MQLRTLLLLLVVTTSLASCEAIGTIFEAGVWTGVILVVLLVAVGGFLFSKFRR